MPNRRFFLAFSSTIKPVCLPVWEAGFLAFESSVLVGGFVPLPSTYVESRFLGHKILDLRLTQPIIKVLF